MLLIKKNAHAYLGQLPYQKVTGNLLKRFTLKVVSKHVVRASREQFFEFFTVLGMSTLASYNSSIIHCNTKNMYVSLMKRYFALSYPFLFFLLCCFIIKNRQSSLRLKCFKTFLVQSINQIKCISLLQLYMLPRYIYMIYY